MLDGPVDLAAPLDLGLPPLRWTMLGYRLPLGPSRDRVSIWRELKRTRAVNLGLGSWALRHPSEDGATDVDPLLEAIERAGGTSEVVEVADGSSRSVELQARLELACSHLWDAFFNDADRVASGCEVGGVDGAAVAQIEGLRRRFAEVRRDDLVGGETSRRARRKLSALVALVPDDERGVGGRTIDPSAFDLAVDVRMRLGGVATHVVTVEPTPSIRSERRFADFTRSVFLDDDPVELEHGTFVFTAPPAAGEARVATLAGRLDLFTRWS